MSGVITEVERQAAGGPIPVIFGQDDGATRIWMIHLSPAPQKVGLHRHDGDEIWRVRRGRLRMTVNGVHVECAAGQLVVVAPNTYHGVVVLDDDTEAEVIGEIAMGEWVTVIEPDGSSREVEVHVPNVPWHRPLPEGAPPTSPEEMLAMLETTHHLL